MVGENSVDGNSAFLSVGDPKHNYSQASNLSFSASNFYLDSMGQRRMKEPPGEAVPQKKLDLLSNYQAPEQLLFKTTEEPIQVNKKFMLSKPKNASAVGVIKSPRAVAMGDDHGSAAHGQAQNLPFMPAQKHKSKESVTGGSEGDVSQIDGGDSVEKPAYGEQQQQVQGRRRSSAAAPSPSKEKAIAALANRETVKPTVMPVDTKVVDGEGNNTSPVNLVYPLMNPAHI